ncbi:MAG: hypothetical protein ABII98_02595 [bacterium]
MQELNRQNLDKEFWVAEYSFEQRCFHHDYIKNSFATNKKSIEEIMKIDNPQLRKEKVLSLSWIPFSIGTCKETSEDIEKMRDFIAITKDCAQFQNPNLLF